MNMKSYLFKTDEEITHGVKAKALFARNLLKRIKCFLEGK